MDEKIMDVIDVMAAHNDKKIDKAYLVWAGISGRDAIEYAEVQGYEITGNVDKRDLWQIDDEVQELLDLQHYKDNKVAKTRITYLMLPLFWASYRTINADDKDAKDVFFSEAYIVEAKYNVYYSGLKYSGKLQHDAYNRPVTYFYQLRPRMMTAVYRTIQMYSSKPATEYESRIMRRIVAWSETQNRDILEVTADEIATALSIQLDTAEKYLARLTMTIESLDAIWEQDEEGTPLIDKIPDPTTNDGYDRTDMTHDVQYAISQLADDEAKVARALMAYEGGDNNKARKNRNYQKEISRRNLYIRHQLGIRKAEYDRIFRSMQQKLSASLRDYGADRGLDPEPEI